jgi:hypothetical protein
MMANVKLSKEELELVINADVILTKNRIIQKVYELFGEVSEEYKLIGKASLLPELLSISPKIAKGEFYRQLPWVMLDYPRNFSLTDTFAIRSFFWWGNFFSITLQLQGKYKEQFLPAIQQNLDKSSGWWYCIDETDAWQHHFESDNYKLLDQTVSLENYPFIKLAKKIPLEQWDNAFDFYCDSFKEIISLLAT